MRSAVLADSGPLYAAVDPDDAYHPQAQRQLKRLARNHLDVIIAYPTLLEAYTLVLHRLGRRNAANWLENILAGAALVNPTGDDYHAASSKFSASVLGRTPRFSSFSGWKKLERWPFPPEPGANRSTPT